MTAEPIHSRPDRGRLGRILLLAGLVLLVLLLWWGVYFLALYTTAPAELSARAQMRQAGDFLYSEQDGGAVLREYRGNAVQLTVPETLNGLPVVTVGASAFCTL
jgi:hypothetical protein